MIEKKKYTFKIREKVEIEIEYKHEIEALSEEDATSYAYKLFKEREYTKDKTLTYTNFDIESQNHSLGTVSSLESEDGTVIATDTF